MPADCRTFSARPILSSDEPQADKHKLERYLHDGRQASCRDYMLSLLLRGYLALQLVQGCFHELTHQLPRAAPWLSL